MIEYFGVKMSLSPKTLSMC